MAIDEGAAQGGGKAVAIEGLRHEIEHAVLEGAQGLVGVRGDDDGMERAGHRPLLVEGVESNIKVTTAADLLLAEFLLRPGMGNGE